MESSADLAAQDSAFQKMLSEAKTFDEMRKIFANDENVSKAFEMLTTDAERYAYMLEHTNDELAQQKILIEQSKAAALEYSKQLNQDANDGQVMIANA